MRRIALGAWLLIALFMLNGCALLSSLTVSDALPDLRLLEPLAWQESPPAAETATDVNGDLRVDLWLDASQVMGGINPNTESMYPHASNKYREGGFHYRYDNQVGMYETVLRCMLSGVEGSRVRVLRCGNERLPDEFLTAQGVAGEGMSPDTLRSIRRDMLTYAIDPMPSLFSGFSGEKMTNSFYSPGSPQLNQMDTLNASLLENLALKDSMAAALNNQIQAIQKNSDPSLLAVGQDDDYPLLYALENIDLTHVSVITFDPAAIRRLTEVAANGSSHALVEELLAGRGVFDAGLCAGLYAFTLDYMGQMASFGPADFSEPLLWGRLDFSNSTGKTLGTLVMPRTLLTLVIGKPEEVERFTSAFENQLAASDTLKVPRGPQSGQLTYTMDGQTVVQEPFGFAYEYTLIRRASVEPVGQDTPGIQLTAKNASTNGSLTTVSLARAQDAALTLFLPLPTLPDGISINVSDLANVSLSVQDSLLLTQTLPNLPDSVVPDGAQTIALRDQLYVFTHESCESPVSCTGITSDGTTLQVAMQADGSALKPGYYRILFSADLPGGNAAWDTPDWVRELNTDITNEQISEWEAFTELLAKNERKRNYISRPYQHAWGDAENTSYWGDPVPEFPRVMLSPGLSELVRQMQNAAQPVAAPYIRYVFDLFVDHQF